MQAGFGDVRCRPCVTCVSDSYEYIEHPHPIGFWLRWNMFCLFNWDFTNSTPVFLPGKSHEQKKLVGYSPWSHKELDMTEWLHFLSLFTNSRIDHNKCNNTFTFSRVLFNMCLKKLTEMAVKEKSNLRVEIPSSWLCFKRQVVLMAKNPPAKCRKHKRPEFDPWVGKIPWRRAWQPTPVLLPGESHGQRSLVGYSP